MVTRMDHDLKQPLIRGATAFAARDRVTPLNKANFPQQHVYPRLMIGGVYRMSLAKLQEGRGLAVYALPACETSTRHRARIRVRSACEGFRQNVNTSGADGCPRHHES
ncbi:hypothetical protein [Bradyrhizobium sp. SYSU BS000235]|uniref:hypothetical protein n=1 Tax=Bradyrhizobium sp. SYSU BS000235 TaxID=3411332 RepID=UPI003C76FD3B